jgi:hypothetical protein
MKMPVAALLVAAALAGAVAMGFYQSETMPAAMRSEPATLPALDAVPTQMLPPNHPPIGSSGGAFDGLAPASDDVPAITWKVPPGWVAAANPNAMRLATYHPSPEVDVSVARAGGTTDANIQRWVGQFDDAGADLHTERTVHGLSVKMVEVSGTYTGAGMMTGAAAEPHRNWTLVGVVVETPGAHYFFKMVGPVDRVHAARASFDAMVASVAPH